MMTLTEYNTIKPKFSITEKKEQYIQTIINNLKFIKVLRKELKIRRTRKQNNVCHSCNQYNSH